MIKLKKDVQRIKVKSIGFENTGGGCMVLYVNIDKFNGVSRIGIDEQYINGYVGSDLEDDECIWSCSSVEELAKIVCEDDVKLLMGHHYNYCKRYDCGSYISKNEMTHHWLREFHSNKITENVLDFIEHLDKSTTEFMDTIDANKSLDDKYNFHIVMNNKACTLLNNADVYEQIRMILVDYVKENG